MENLPTTANENAASVYRHEPRSLEFFNEQSDGGCNNGCGSCNSNGSAAELLFLLSLWGFLSQRKQQAQNNAAEQWASEQTEEPSC